MEKKTDIKVVQNIAEANAVTHGGLYHQDEVLATVIVAFAMSAPIRVARVLKPDSAPADAIVYDVGGGEYDHHQVGGNGNRPNNGIAYAASGLLWRKFGDTICERYFPEAPHKLATIVDEMFVAHVDAEDVGMADKMTPTSPTSLNRALAFLGPAWDEGCATGMDQAFEDACELMGIFFDRILTRKAADLRGERLVREAVKKSSNGIMVLPCYVPWLHGVLSPREDLKDNAAKIKFVVFPSLRGGWNAQAVPSCNGSKELRCAFPESWRGLPAEELRKTTDVINAVFAHPSGFLAGAETRGGALRLAETAIAVATVMAAVAKVNRAKLTDTAFVNVQTEEVGLCVDVVYSYDDYDGWGESVLVSMDEEYNVADIEAARNLAKKIANILDIPVKEDIEPMGIIGG